MEFGEDVVVVHNICVQCMEEGSFVLTRKQYEELFVEGKYIQDVFTELTADEREFMISGTHAECWNELWNLFDEQEQEQQ